MTTTVSIHKKLLQKYLQKQLLKYLYDRNIPIFPLSSERTLSQFGLGCKQKRAWVNDINSCAGFLLANDRLETFSLLEREKIPVPSNVVLEKKEDLGKIESEVGYPVVMKPARGTHGGDGVFVNVKDEQEARKNFPEIKKFCDQVLVEKMLDGYDHRVLVIDDKVIAVLQRIPANVTGDGKQTVKELVESENERRQKLPASQKASLLPITLDDSTEKTLEQQDESLSSVPKSGKKVFLRFNANVGTGGETVGVSDQIHHENAEYCLQAARTLDLKIAGIDVMTADISLPISKTGGGIIEMNTRPGIVMHKHPGSGKPVDTLKIFADFLYPEPSEAWIPINKNGQTIDSVSGLEDVLETKPKEVWRLIEGGKENVVKKPDKVLLSYLLDGKVTKVNL